MELLKIKKNEKRLSKSEEKFFYKPQELKKIADGLEISVIEFLEQAATDPAAVERYENYLVTRRESYHRKKQEAERTA